MTNEEIDAQIISFDPFWGDDVDARTISNRMVVVRKAHECANCLGPIPAGSRVRAMKQAFDGLIQTYRWCAECCAAMAAERMWLESDDEELESEDDALPPFERRARIGASAAKLEHK